MLVKQGMDNRKNTIWKNDGFINKIWTSSVGWII